MVIGCSDPSLLLNIMLQASQVGLPVQPADAIFDKAEGEPQPEAPEKGGHLKINKLIAGLTIVLLTFSGNASAAKLSPAESLYHLCGSTDEDRKLMCNFWIVGTAQMYFISNPGCKNSDSLYAIPHTRKLVYEHLKRYEDLWDSLDMADFLFRYYTDICFSG